MAQPASRRKSVSEMAGLFIIRHGEPAGSWADSPDPGLSAKGLEQAKTAATSLMRHAPEGLPVFSSPMKRAQETAAPLAQAWEQTPRLLPAFSEIPSPNGELAARGVWIQQFMASQWDNALQAEGSENLAAWRGDLLAGFAALAEENPKGAVVFSHFIAINALLAAANGGREVLQARPAHASIWHFQLGRATPQLVAAGAEIISSVR